MGGGGGGDQWLLGGGGGGGGLVSNQLSWPGFCGDCWRERSGSSGSRPGHCPPGLRRGHGRWPSLRQWSSAWTRPDHRTETQQGRIISTLKPHTHTHTHTHTHMDTCTYIHMHARRYSHTQAHTHIYTLSLSLYTRACTPAHTHTHSVPP